MADIYPQSMLCRFEAYPPRVRVICGPAFSRVRSTPYSFGSQVILTQTPKSGRMDGTLSQGQPLPVQEIIYSDTGSDTVFALKLSHYGFGRFYLPAAGSAFYALTIIKGLRVEAPTVRKSFETVDVWETRIPAGTDLAGAGEAGVVVQDGDGTGVLWFVGEVPEGGLTVSGTLQLGGAQYLQIQEG